jgi:hypothetical protein
MSQKLQKAGLYSLDHNDTIFEFMFNPTELEISRRVNVTENRGARTQNQGIPKVSFAHPNAATISIKNIILDTYERDRNPRGRDVGEQIGKLTETVKFIPNKRRPPICIFYWGGINYLRCYVESVNYQLTLFLPDGTPVRAKASLTLKEVDKVEPASGEPNPPADPNRREIDTRW